ncbi:MAG: substrate-binding domain-containing protein [Gemmatimonadaceae bacterium]
MTILTAASPHLTLPAANGFIVVVHADNPATTIEREPLSNIFFKRVVKWPDGTTADPVDLTMKQPARLAFSASVHKKSVGAVRAFWQQQIFSGREIPPAEINNEADVIAYVIEHPGAVGYVSSSAHLTSGVKPLSVLGLVSP